MSNSSEYKSLWKKIKPALESVDALYNVLSINHATEKDSDRLMHLHVHFARGVMLSMLRKYKIEFDFFREALEYYFEQFYLTRKNLQKKTIYTKETALRLAKSMANLDMVDSINVPAEESFHDEKVNVCVEAFAKLANDKSDHFKSPIKKFFSDLFD